MDLGLASGYRPLAPDAPNSKTLPREDELWRDRALGAVIPELDDFDAGERRSLPASGNPILPLAFPSKPRGSSVGLGPQKAQPLLSKREKNPTGHYAGKAQAREAEQRHQHEIE